MEIELLSPVVETSRRERAAARVPDSSDEGCISPEETVAEEEESRGGSSDSCSGCTEGTEQVQSHSQLAYRHALAALTLSAYPLLQLRRRRRQKHCWWNLPEMFSTVASYLHSSDLRVLSCVSSTWAYGAERILSLHCAAGDALQTRTETADFLLENFVLEMHALVKEVVEEPATVAQLTLRVHASLAAEECRVMQTRLRAVMASGEDCDGLCAQMVQVATARRDVCSAILSYAQRLQEEARRALRVSELVFAAARGGTSIDPCAVPLPSDESDESLSWHISL